MAARAFSSRLARNDKSGAQEVSSRQTTMKSRPRSQKGSQQRAFPSSLPATCSSPRSQFAAGNEPGGKEFRGERSLAAVFTSAIVKAIGDPKRRLAQQATQHGSLPAIRTRALVATTRNMAVLDHRMLRGSARAVVRSMSTAN